MKLQVFLIALEACAACLAMHKVYTFLNSRLLRVYLTPQWGNNNFPYYLPQLAVISRAELWRQITWTNAII